MAGLAGGIAINSSQAIITKNEISNNFGSGIALYDNTNIEINNTKITDNAAYYSGGGLAIELNSSAVVKNSIINNNKAQFGGGIGLLENSSLELANSEITGNVAEEDGGAIDTYDNNDVKIVNSIISGNSAFYEDGIANYDGTSNIEIIDNTVEPEVVEPEVVEPGTNQSAIRIEAEDADRFVEYSADSNYGGQYHFDGGLDIKTSSEGGYNVGWIESGESLEYDVNVAESGSYDVLLRVATNITSAREIEVSIDDISLSTVSFGHTGGWQSYTDVIIEDVAIELGMKELQLDALSSGFNVNYIELI